MTTWGDQASAPHTLAADVVVVGGGIAGISLALRLPADLAIILVTKQALGESNTRYAQGGLAAAVGPLDSPASHVADTLAAGAGHSDPTAVRILAEGGRDAVAWLVAAGAQFDPALTETPAADLAAVGEARLALGHEAAHSYHRILHAHGDATGAEIERALVAAVRRRPNITVLEDALVTELVTQDGVCVGVRGSLRAGALFAIAARAVVLANGGAGRLWQRTSNPPGATGDGLALAWHAGAVLTDLEFMQFHPTVLAPPDPAQRAFLISEAVRGEGAYLRNARGERFMLGEPGAELAPRDVVARAIALEMLREESDHVQLDLSHLDPDRVRARFPTIAATCAQIGIDIARDPIPVAPAAHYFMGGVAVDLEGRTTVPGLWAVGEVACTGVHGANRLASNSLLEGVVFGARAAADCARALADEPSMADWHRSPRFSGASLATEVAAPPLVTDPGMIAAVRAIMWERVGLFRDALRLERAIAELASLSEQGNVDEDLMARPHGFAAYEAANVLLVGQLIARAALARQESRGAHTRRDYPDADPARAGRRFFIHRAPVGASTAKDSAMPQEASHDLR